jgi:hypothetical protein
MRRRARHRGDATGRGSGFALECVEFNTFDPSGISVAISVPGLPSIRLRGERMSRGLGKLQHKIIAALADGRVDTIGLTCRLTGMNPCPAIDVVNVRRALRSLARRGLVVDLGRGFVAGRRYWALPEHADAMLARLQEMGWEWDGFGSRRGVPRCDPAWRARRLASCEARIAAALASEPTLRE